MGILDVNGLTVRYDEPAQPVVDSQSFSVPPG